MAQRYGRKPSEFLDPRGEWDEWETYCFDESIFLRAIADENRRFKKDRKDGSGATSGKKPEKSASGLVFYPGEGRMEGEFGGRVGYMSPSFKRKWLAGGGQLPDKRSKGPVRGRVRRGKGGQAQAPTDK